MKTNIEDVMYFVPSRISIDPTGSYLLFGKYEKLLLHNIKTGRSKVIEYPGGVEYFEFSSNGHYFVVKTTNQLYRYEFNGGFKEIGCIEFSGNSRLNIDNSGDVVLLTISDDFHDTNSFYYWRLDSKTLISYEDIFKHIDLFRITLDTENSIVLFYGTYTYSYPKRDKRGERVYGKIVFENNSKGDSISICSKNHFYLDQGFRGYYQNNKIISTKLDEDSIKILDKDLQQISSVPVDELKLKNNISHVSASPNSNFIAILWSEWDGIIDSYYINIVDMADYSVKEVIPVKNEMINFERFSVTDEGMLFLAHPTEDVKNIMLYKSKGNELKKKRSIKLRL